MVEAAALGEGFRTLLLLRRAHVPLALLCLKLSSWGIAVGLMGKLECGIKSRLHCTSATGICNALLILASCR